MTPDRARVEAWMWEKCPHDPLRLRHLCPDCLLAYGAELVVLENQACIDVLQKFGNYWHDALPDDRPELMNGLNQVAATIRARREGPGGEK